MPVPGKLIRFGEFEADLQLGRLFKRGVKVKLREQSFQVLALLLEAPGQLVTREDLRRRLWPDHVYVDFENSLNTAVGRLREALGDSAQRPLFIETLPKRGYRFVATVSESSQPAGLVRTQISLAKITPPKVSGVLLRKRLFRALEAKKERPIIWISGPAGSGKTTLVASYVQERKFSCLWYRMDEGDDDLGTFFYYLGLGGERVAPRIRRPLPLLTSEYLQGIPVFALRFFEDLFGRLKKPAVVVFDNYHSVAEESKFHEVIAEALDSIPEGINVIVLSRHALPSALTRLRANGLVSILGWDDLRLTVEETAGIVDLRKPEIRSEELIAQLHSAADGWIAGLMLMLESVKDQILPPARDKLSREEIFDYFGSQFFTKLGHELQTFLTKTAFLPRITVKMAEELSGMPHAAGLLADLTRNNCFTERQRSAEPVYRYHQLFREFLAARARAEMTPADSAALLERSAHRLEESGAIEDAAALLLQVGNTDRMTRFVLTHAPALMTQGRHKLVGEWLAGFPPEVVDRSPWLLYWKGACLMPETPAQSTAYFERAFRLFEAQHDDSGTLLAWSGAVDSILFSWDNLPLHSWFSWMETWLSHNRRFPSLQIEARVAVSISGMLTWAIPSRSDTEEWMNRALALSRDTGDIILELQALSNCLMYFSWMGDVRCMHRALERAKAIAHSPSAPPVSLIIWKIADGRTRLFLPTEYGDYFDTFREAIDLAEKSGIRTFDSMLYAMAGLEALSRTDTVQAEEYLHKLEAIAPRTPRALSNQREYLAGWIQLIRGNLDHALVLAQEGLKTAVECAVPFSQICLRQLITKILDEKGEHQAALREVSTVKEIISRMGNSPLFTYFTLLDESHILFDKGDEKRAIKVLRSACAIGSAYGYKTLTNCWRPAVLASLCAKALENDIETSYIQDLIRCLNL